MVPLDFLEPIFGLCRALFVAVGVSTPWREEVEDEGEVSVDPEEAVLSQRRVCGMDSVTAGVDGDAMLLWTALQFS